MTKSEKEIIRDALAYIENAIHRTNNYLADSTTTDERISDTWKQSCNAKAKAELENAIKMFQWIVKRRNIQIPSAFTDADVTQIGGVLDG